MIEPVYVDVQKVASAQVGETRYMPETRAAMKAQIHRDIEQFVGGVVTDVRYEEMSSVEEWARVLNWWELLLSRFGKVYPPTRVAFTRVVGYARGCHHPFTGEWIEVPTSSTAVFLPPRGGEDARNHPS